MVIIETKWPKDIKRWRIISRLVDNEITYHCQANLSFMCWGAWQDLGPSANIHEEGFEERLRDWIDKQCEQHKKVEEAVVWAGKENRGYFK